MELDNGTLPIKQMFGIYYTAKSAPNICVFDYKQLCYIFSK